MPLWKQLVTTGTILTVLGFILIPLPGPGFVIASSGVIMIIFAVALRLLDPPKR
jgi:hypothetical protein